MRKVVNIDHNAARYWKPEYTTRLKEIGEELGVKELDDWYKVSREKLYYKAPFIKKYFPNVFTALKIAFPQHKWNYSKFLYKPFYSDLNNQRTKLEEIGTKLGVQKLDDWYKVSRETLFMEGQYLLAYHKDFFSALKKLYPEHPWDITKFETAQQGHWKDLANQKRKLDDVGRELGVTKLDDWYHVSRYAVHQKAPFIKRYYSSVVAALEAIYPHNWDRTKFSKMPYGHWKLIENQKQKLEEIAVRLNVNQLEDWYRVPRTEVYSNTPFMRYHKNLFSALRALYPQHHWQHALFSRVPSNVWQSTTEDMKLFLDQLIAKYNINTRTDWLKLTPSEWKQVKRYAASRFKSVSRMFSTLFPTMKWDDSTSKYEAVLKNMLNEVTEVESQIRIGSYSIDLFLPKWKMVVEYQGSQHYKQTHRGNLVDQLDRDRRKMADLKRLGITVVHVGYWWDGSWSHLRSTLLAVDPTLQLPDATKSLTYKSTTNRDGPSLQ